jgi:hypothetical protein
MFGLTNLINQYFSMIGIIIQSMESDYNKKRVSKGKKVLPGFEPGFREVLGVIKIPSDNHYTTRPCAAVLILLS